MMFRRIKLFARRHAAGMLGRRGVRYSPRRDGLDADNKSVVMFDSRMPLQAGPVRPAMRPICGSPIPIRSAFPSRTTPSAIPVGVSPLDNGTKFRVVEFPPLDAATEAKMEPAF